MNILLIIDMQEASFVNSDKFNSENVVCKINQLSQHTRENGGRVIFIQHDGTNEEGLLPLTAGWEILSSLTKSDSDLVIRKTLNDSFCHTVLNQTLLRLNVDNIIISGWATDFCVDTTIRSAISLGHNVVLISDCHTVSNRPHLDAEKVIEHHNWVWQNLLTTNSNMRVLPLEEWCN